MAVIKFTNSNHGLKSILQYITQYAKTEAKFLSGKDCMPESALNEMQTVKRMYGKEANVTGVHQFKVEVTVNASVLSISTGYAFVGATVE